jgi:hypothetical protein
VWDDPGHGVATTQEVKFLGGGGSVTYEYGSYEFFSDLKHSTV